jgi:NADH dehydrogenase
VHHNSLQVTLIEAAPRILPALPETLALKAQTTLTDLGVNVATQKTVSAIKAHTLVTPEGEIQADLLVWAAGIKAPAFLANLGLPTNRINQLDIDFSLRVKGQKDIFAIGDCAFLIDESTEDRPVPPTAQAAHQMAATCAHNIIATLQNQPNQDFKYCDHGALVSLSRFQTLGNLLDQLFHKNWMVEGKLAHWAYASLYRQHQLALHGYWKTAWILLGSVIEKRIKPKLKLY